MTPSEHSKQRGRRTVFLIFGADPSAVYHATMDCPSITSRWGWVGSVVEARLNPDGSQNVKRGLGAGQHHRRPCKRCDP